MSVISKYKISSYGSFYMMYASLPQNKLFSIIDIFPLFHDSKSKKKYQSLNE